MITVSSTTTVTVHMTPQTLAADVTTTTTTRTSSHEEATSSVRTSSPMATTLTNSRLPASSSSATAASQSRTRPLETSITSESSIPEPPIFLSTSRTSARTPVTSIRAPVSSVSSSSLPAQSSFDPVVGAGNTCVDRLKIEDMQAKQPDSFNLLLLAWRDLHLTPESDDLSFFSLSRIHGAPFAPWQMPQEGDYNWSTGYCTHHSGIFLPWHRPLLVLFEVALPSLVESIKNRKPDIRNSKPSIEKPWKLLGNSPEMPARDTRRRPMAFWDWSDPNTQSYLPTAVTVDTVAVVEPGPDGSPVATNIPNPLNAYTFQSRNSTSTFWGKFATWPTTLRQPDAAGNTQEELVNATLQNSYSK
ncbi:hypothetical protein TWF696_002948 [Orbilia brochopaga]|uniref:tyrosinase n=1 Tax=Orbilia brochopaga TaxID=3140254 RepID=A0AAV9TYZ1_9PEZI